jgi:HSP20 family protein
MASWNPWLEMQRLERDLGELRGAGTQFPTLRANSDEKAVHLRALVPGFAIEDLEVEVRGDELRLRGKGQLESAHGVREFERVLKLPFAIEAEKVKAVAKDGILEIELPRAAADAPRRITVRSE